MVHEWEIRVTDVWRDWFEGVDPTSQALIVDAIDRLAEAGPALGRPLVDHVRGSRVHNLKELRPGSAGRSEIRMLFAFDPWRSAIILVGGDKAGRWSTWYTEAIDQAEHLYDEYLTERKQDGDQP